MTMELSNQFSTLCLTCLSFNRKMIQLKELVTVYQKCIGNVMLLVNEIDTICWECHAYLCKIQMFQKRVQKAQQLLNIDKNNVNSLSQLSICQNPNIDLTEMAEVNIKVEKGEVVEELVNEFTAENDLNIDCVDEDKLKIRIKSSAKEINALDVIEYSSEVENEYNNDKINPIKGVNNNFKQKVTNVQAKVRKKSKGIKKGVQGTTSNLKNRKVKSTLKFKVESSTNDLGNAEDTAFTKEVFRLGEKCNGLFETNYDDKTFDKSIKKESKKRTYKSKENDDSENFYARDSKKLKYNYLNIDTLFDKSLKEEPPSDMKREGVEKDCDDIKLYGCKACSAVVKSIDRKVHMKGHFKLMQCLTCCLIFDGRQEFFKHYNELHSKFICDHCGVKFKKKSSMEKHMRTLHLGVTCKECGRRFRNYRYWKIHHRHQHQMSAPAYCVECDLRFANEYRYKSHLKGSIRHKARPKLSIPCPDCDKVFTKRIHMKVHHAFVHLKQFNNRCEACDKNFLRKCDLTRHNRHVHDGVQPIKNKICYICGRGFSTNRILSNHIVTHTGERPHACELCAARFTQEAALATHRRSRHPEAGPLPLPLKYKHRAFPCGLCSANYTTAERLEKHKKDIHLVNQSSSLI